MADETALEGNPSIQQLRADIDGIKRNLPGPVSKLGAFLGIPALIISIILGSNDIYKRVTKSPHLSATAGQFLQTSYSPAEQQLKLEFLVSVANYGDLPTVVEEVHGELSSNTAVRGYQIPLSGVEFRCVSGNAMLPVPFPVPAGPASTLACSAQTSIPDSVRSQLLRGENKFTVVFRGQQKSGTEIAYCFSVPDDYGEEMSRRAGPVVRRRFIDALCE